MEEKLVCRCFFTNLMLFDYCLSACVSLLTNITFRVKGSVVNIMTFCIEVSSLCTIPQHKIQVLQMCSKHPATFSFQPFYYHCQ